MGFPGGSDGNAFRWTSAFQFFCKPQKTLLYVAYSFYFISFYFLIIFF